MQLSAAAEWIASTGFQTLASPSPSASMPYCFQTSGMNWAMPRAPAGETARASQALSVAICAAST